MVRLFVFAVGLVVFCCAMTAAAEPNIFLELRGESLEGMPLAWNDQKIYLLVRDGRMVDFHPDEAKNFGRSTRAFTPTTAPEMRVALQREFGNRFDVSGSGHYLVVHPVGQKSQWGTRFEDLYRSFQVYFTARGLRPNEPQFPLVAVVLPNQQDFQRMATADGAPSTSGLMGYYSAKSNRIVMYDFVAANPNADWSINAETIIHEAAHQTAFNTGIHRRFADTPTWICEGLGCLFEARGVWASRLHTQRSDRVNAYRAADFAKWAKRRPAGTLAETTSNDRLFQASPEDAYAEAWAFTFFLSENEPRKYLELVQKTAALKPFEEYKSPDRVRDFEAIFGNDWRMLEARFLRFMAEVK
jgi:hypothetical protein